jgi:hypothetical protein
VAPKPVLKTALRSFLEMASGLLLNVGRNSQKWSDTVFRFHRIQKSSEADVSKQFYVVKSADKSPKKRQRRWADILFVVLRGGLEKNTEILPSETFTDWRFSQV